MNEFSIIQKFFTECGQSNQQVKIDIGDDAAIVTSDIGSDLVMTMDTLIEGVHFPFDTSPEDIAYKALAVNLSDLAAMAAEPAWFLLSLTLPNADENWLKRFSTSLATQAKKYNIRLIGGDTCRGPLSITIQATGVVKESAILRSTAKEGDAIFVSGVLGQAALGLAILLNDLPCNEEIAKPSIKALNCPTPRFDIARLVKPYASSMIDISDGLVGDLGHILEQSQCGGVLYLDQIPMPKVDKNIDILQYALKGGDDYELCFTIAKDKIVEFIQLTKKRQLDVTQIGEIVATGFQVFNNSTDKEIIDSDHLKAYKHF